MALRLSSADVARFEATLSVLLTPLAHPTIRSWCHDIMRSGQALLGADQAIFGLWFGDELIGEGSDPNAQASLGSYVDYYIRVDETLMRRRRELGLEVYHTTQLIDPHELRQTEIYADWLTPYRLFDQIGMGIEIGRDLPALTHFYHEREGGTRFEARHRMLLRLLLPAFKAGVHAWLRVADQRSALARTFDALPAPLLVADVAGRVLHANPAWQHQVTADPAGWLVLAAARQLARDLGTGTGSSAAHRVPLEHAVQGAQAAHRRVRTSQGAYTLRGTVVAAALLGRGNEILVTLESAERALDPVRGLQAPASTATSGQLSADMLRRQFGLTARQSEVAALLAQGWSDAAIAHQLGISARTAEHHAEAVREKLGVRARAEVPSRLRPA
jgi:DNA-binding CsgD family transcriptional regulator/PAS domain-containing protein